MITQNKLVPVNFNLVANNLQKLKYIFTQTKNLVLKDIKDNKNVNQ